MKEYLSKIANECGIHISEEALEKFQSFYFLLIERNKSVNLTSITEYKDVALKHFIDSLKGERFIPQGAVLADVGTGAGFPGIPLKIFRPDIKIVLMDGLNKRIEFLIETISKLGLKEIEAKHIRAEDAGRGNYREQFDVVVARAVARLNILCEYAIPLVKKGGVFIAYKTKDEEELFEAKRAALRLGGEIERVDDFKLNELKREIIVIRKISPTPDSYPRANGKIKKSPL